MNGIAVLPASDSSTASRHSFGQVVVFTNGRTNRNVATIHCMKGTESKSTGEGRLGRYLPCRKYSNHARRCRTGGLPCGASLTQHTSPSAATSGRTRGTAWKSTGGGALGRRSVSNVFHSCPQVQNHCPPARRPAAQQAADTRTGWVVALVFFEVAIQSCGRFGGVIHEGAHTLLL
jgi:hypothetical protein